MKSEVILDTLLPMTIGIREFCRQNQLQLDNEILPFLLKCNMEEMLRATYDFEDIFTKTVEYGDDNDIHELYTISQLIPINITSLFDKQAHIIGSNRVLFCHILVKYGLMTKSKYQHHKKHEKKFRELDRKLLHSLFTKNIQLFNKLLPLIQYNQLSELLKLAKVNKNNEPLVVA